MGGPEVEAFLNHLASGGSFPRPRKPRHPTPRFFSTIRRRTTIGRHRAPIIPNHATLLQGPQQLEVTFDVRKKLLKATPIQPNDAAHAVKR